MIVTKMLRKAKNGGNVWIPFAQAVALALITGITQYFIAVAPLKVKVEKLQQQVVQPNSLMGEEVVFATSSLLSKSLMESNDFKVNEKWEADCKDLGADTLRKMNYKLIDLPLKNVVRGYQGSKNLGVQCESAVLSVRIYGMAPKEIASQFKTDRDTILALMKQKWTDLQDPEDK